MLLRDTKILRTTLSQQTRVILPPCEHGLIRRVQVLVPSSPRVFIQEMSVKARLPTRQFEGDKEIKVTATVEELFGRDAASLTRYVSQQYGANREYKLPPFPTGQAIIFRLKSDQFLFGQCGEGAAFGSLVVEFRAADNSAGTGIDD